MTTAGEQRNPYKGTPPRPWVRLRLESYQGAPYEIDLVADTGSPFPIIVSEASRLLLKRQEANELETNFGHLRGAWFQLDTPELGLTQRVEGYGSDVVATTVRASSPDFGGLIGLPLLRMLEFGGDAQAFWVRRATGSP